MFIVQVLLSVALLAVISFQAVSPPTGRGCDVCYKFLSGLTKTNTGYMSENLIIFLYSHHNSSDQPII